MNWARERTAPQIRLLLKSVQIHPHEKSASGYRRSKRCSGLRSEIGTFQPRIIPPGARTNVRTSRSCAGHGFFFWCIARVRPSCDPELHDKTGTLRSLLRARTLEVGSTAQLTQDQLDCACLCLSLCIAWTQKKCNRGHNNWRNFFLWASGFNSFDLQ